MKYIITPILVAILAFTSVGCSTLNQAPTPAQTQTLATIEPLVSVAVTVALASAKSPAQQQSEALVINSLGQALYLYSTGTVPSAAKLKADLTGVVPSAQLTTWAPIIASLVSIYSAYYTQPGANPTLLTTALTDMGIALQAGAAPYL